jgi:hypothetical protein
VTESFSPRTVITVALASLVAGFVTVFGGGMVALRGRAPRAETRPLPPLAPPPPEGSPPAETTAPEALPEAPAAGEGSDAAASADGSAPVGVTIAPATVSRCFAGMAPTAIPGARCDRLPALDQHLAARAAPVAACAQGARGRLTFIMDLRFSNQHVSAWGGPTSTIANAGVVSLCVRRATAPLPLAGIPHAHDRYIVSIPIEW